MIDGTRAAPRRTLTLVYVVAIAAFLGSAAATVAYLGRQTPSASEPVTVVRGTSSVVAAVRDLARLESVSYHMEKVIDMRDRQAHLFGLFESQDAVLLVAAADVVAGVDLALMRDGDIEIDPVAKSARLVLPSPTILSASLDSARTYVHTRSTDMLALPAPSLETRARKEAERALREAALEAGILARARANTARTVRTLVESLGFERVEVSFHDE